MGELILAGNKLRDASMAGRAARVIKTLKNLDVSRNEIGRNCETVTKFEPFLYVLIF